MMGEDSKRRESKAAGTIMGRRQIISTVEVADGEGGNSRAGVLSDVCLK